MALKAFKKNSKTQALRKQRGPEINFDSDEQRELIEQAADRRGLSVTSFIRTSALIAANTVMKEDQLLLLSDRDWDKAVSLMVAPPPPNEALKKLLGHKSK